MTAMSSRRNFTLNSLPTFQRPERRSWLSLSVQSWIRLSGSSPALQLGSQSRPGSSTALETRTFRSRQLNSWQSAPAQRRSWRSRERLTFSWSPIRKKQQSSLSKQLSRPSSRALRARDSTSNGTNNNDDTSENTNRRTTLSTGSRVSRAGARAISNGLAFALGTRDDTKNGTIFWK